MSITSVMIPFRDFDEQGIVRIYQHGILPHWRQHGCTYFVTFRQADSIPKSAILEFVLFGANGYWLMELIPRVNPGRTNSQDFRTQNAENMNSSLESSWIRFLIKVVGLAGSQIRK